MVENVLKKKMANDIVFMDERAAQFLDHNSENILSR